MKKLMLLALTFAMSTMLYAHGGYGPDNRFDKDSEGWKEMNAIHEIMHNTSIKGDKTDKGVTFEITASSESAVSSIKKQFVEDKDKLDDYFKNITVSVNGLDNGVKLTLESDDENTVQKLQSYGTMPVYRYLQNSMFTSQNGMGFNGPMGYHHGGYGPGMMHGQGNGRGYGPGMMYDNDDDEGTASPNSMHWDDRTNGYGPGMM